MKKKLTKVGVIVLIVVLGSSYDLWRGYHEDGTVGTAIGYAVLGWIVFGIPVFVWYLVRSRDRKPGSSAS